MNKITNTSLTTWAYAIFRALKDYDIDGTQLFERNGVTIGESIDKSLSVSRNQLNAIWRDAVEVSKDDALGLSIRDYINDPALNALATSIQASNSVRDALKITSKYYNAISMGTQLTSLISHTLELEISQSLETPLLAEEDIDVALSLIIKYCATLTIKQVHPVKVEFKRTRPKNILKYQSVFSCPIEFSSNKNAITFPKEFIDEPILSANPLLSTYVEKYLFEKIKKRQNSKIQDQTYSIIVTMLPYGTPKLSDIAVKLNMSERTLQRKFQLEKACFKKLLNTVRVDLAVQYLSDNYKVNEIAPMLGFSEPSNFIRFFKAQSGRTPSEFLH